MPRFELSRRETLTALAATAAAPFVGGAAGPRDAQASALLRSIGTSLVRLVPDGEPGATSLGVDVGAQAHLRYMLSDKSASGQQRIAASLKRDLARAEAFDTAALSFPVRTSIEVIRSAYSIALEGFALPYGDVAVGGWRNSPYVVIQNVGAYIDTPRILDANHPIEKAADAEAYLSRLSQYPGQLDGELERIRSAREHGLVPPAFLLDKAIGQLTLAAKNARNGGNLVESLVRRTREKKIAGNWEERARSMVTRLVGPALERQVAELQAERAVATDVPGMWSRPHGQDYYRWALKASTTTKLTSDEVHALGLEQLAELHGRMDPLLKGLGYTQGSVGQRMQALARDPRYKFSDGDKGRAEIVAYIEQRLAMNRAVLPRGFRTLVPARLRVKRMPAEEEPGAPAAYGGSGSIDGKMPGTFWINLRTTDLHSKYSLPDLAAHEAIPGHIWQGEYANRMPLIRAMLQFNAYTEGWALYAEQLVDELGVYDGFPAGRLGYLQSMAFRCCRLVVDSGLHAKRWTRRQAVDFFVERNGSNPLEVASEVDRYCSWPGQACGYKIGHSTIDRLRDKARAELGPKYDLRAFDDALVLGGNVPMDVLAKNVDDYIARTRAT